MRNPRKIYLSFTVVMFFLVFFKLDAKQYDKSDKFQEQMKPFIDQKNLLSTNQKYCKINSNELINPYHPRIMNHSPIWPKIQNYSSHLSKLKSSNLDKIHFASGILDNVIIKYFGYQYKCSYTYDNKLNMSSLTEQI